jgi:hypothetical protein
MVLTVYAVDSYPRNNAHLGIIREGDADDAHLVVVSTWQDDGEYYEEKIVGENVNVEGVVALARAYVEETTLQRIEIPVTERTRFDAPLLTVGALRSMMTGLPDDTHVLIATDGWFTNVETVQLPGHSGDAEITLTLYPTVKASEAGDFDGRQF